MAVRVACSQGVLSYDHNSDTCDTSYAWYTDLSVRYPDQAVKGEAEVGTLEAPSDHSKPLQQWASGKRKRKKEKSKEKMEG